MCSEVGVVSGKEVASCGVSSKDFVRGTSCSACTSSNFVWSDNFEDFEGGVFDARDAGEIIWLGMSVGSTIDNIGMLTP